ncbi:MFS transporter [Marinobacter bohaiensis]|uniref:MFS transporter n=1 Tax=Marinobacter bohaiensis TaxID=2201898 RepID=UPI000DAE15D1|nr:MFS transporter [Marinobacter bohaiensis]
MTTEATPAPDHPVAPNALRNLVVVSLCLTAAILANTMLVLAVPFKAIELGVGPSLVGVIISAPYVLPMLLAIPMGGLVSRIGCQKMIIAGALGMAAGPGVTLLLPSVPSLFATQAIVGLANMVLIISAQTVVSSLASGKRLEQFFGWYTTCLSGGQLLGPILSGFLIDHFSVNASLTAIVFVPLISAVGALFFSREVRRSGKAARSKARYRDQWRLLRSNPGMQTSIMLTVTALFVLSIHSSFLPVYLESLSLAASSIGLLLSIRAISSMAVRLAMSRIIDLCGGRNRAILICIVLITGSLTVTGLAGEHYALLVVLAMIIGVAGGISQPLSMVILSESVQPEQRPASMATRLMGNRGAQMLGPVLIGFLADVANFTVAFAAVGSVLLVVFMVWVVRSGVFSQRAAAQ